MNRIVAAAAGRRFLKSKDRQPEATASATLRLCAFAKINTGLKILGKRADGFHEIRTVYQTIDLHDRLEISLSAKPGITITCSDTSLPCDRRNLVYRACELWKTETKFKGGFRIHLDKSIPTGGGLGGGSSDAAAALLGLERLTGNCLEWSARFKVASALGSDVPLFLLGGRVLGCGRGEEIYPLTALPRRICLLVHPGFAISTPEAYQKAGKLTSPSKNRKVNGFGVWSQFPLENWGPAENDFEKFVFAKWPELGKVKDQFIRAGAETASLTGSGSALYALFVSARQLKQAPILVPTGWRVFFTRTLDRSEYHRRLFVK
ncbi:MAG TPA: 4-(cytidine 5'-diphospho)-2-C-methyl-D-erythritol kinase [Terriglobia bacterium]|nr:4-(cytidine 5'-diphospho)-2-C-methyl-D-erythritol kinase [Terriglobia bacterium]